MDERDEDLLIAANKVQERIEQSGVSLMSVETSNGEVLAAIRRVFGVDTKVITFDMFKDAVRGLNRVGLIHGYENA